MKLLVTVMVLLSGWTGHCQTSFNIYFDFNKHHLTGTARMQLDSFLLAEKTALSTVQIQLDGHCDFIGADEYNNRLSGQRVAAVKKYLVANGIRAVHIGDETGHGEKEPLNENKTAEERQVNRRVEISIAKNLTDPVLSLKEKIADSTTTIGTNIVLQNINFVGGMHRFLPASAPILIQLLDAMNTFPQLVIRVEGHICCEEHQGDGLDNETGIVNLSEARAKAVKDYLVANNIPADRITYKGFGHSAPIYPYPERTEEERTQNRRVEIKIISK